jgi:transcriptional regulator with XRE-family HTH domain
VSIGDEIRAAREAASLSQQDLADKAKLHRTYINMIERGRKNPTLDVFFRICDALNIPPSKLIARIEVRRKKRG